MEFTLRDCQLSALKYQAEQAEGTVLFLHGWLDNAASFIPLITEFKKINPNLNYIAVDLIGHGHSSHSQSGFYSFHDYLDLLHQMMSKLDTPVHLVGHSMGALIASCYSAAFPEHVLSLMQIEGYGPLYESEHHSISRLKKGIVSRQRVVSKAKRYFPNIEAMIAVRALRTGLSKAQIAPIVYRDAIEQEQGWQWRHDPKLKADSLYRMSELHMKQVIDLFPAKNLLVLGETGFATLPLHYKEYGNPNTHSIEIDGGHHCHISDPKPIARAFFDLLHG